MQYLICYSQIKSYRILRSVFFFSLFLFFFFLLNKNFPRYLRTNTWQFNEYQNHFRSNFFFSSSHQITINWNSMQLCFFIRFWTYSQPFHVIYTLFLSRTKNTPFSTKNKIEKTIGDSSNFIHIHKHMHNKRKFLFTINFFFDSVIAVKTLFSNSLNSDFCWFVCWCSFVFRYFTLVSFNQIECGENTYISFTSNYLNVVYVCLFAFVSVFLSPLVAI